jgi:hypothetical protein
MSEMVISGLAGVYLYEGLAAANVAPTHTFCLRANGDGYAFGIGAVDADDCVAVFRDRVVFAAARSLLERLGACRLEANLHGGAVNLQLRKGGPTADETQEVLWESPLP